MEYNGGYNPELQRYFKEFQEEIQSLTNQNSLLKERLELSEPISKATKLTLDELDSIHELILSQMAVIRRYQKADDVHETITTIQGLVELVALL